MTLAEYDAYCAALPATHTVIQWGGAHVWKVGPKVFALGREEDGAFSVSFKVSDMAFEMLRTEPGLRPAPYLASRGLKWIQHFSGESMDDAGLRAYLAESHRLIAAKLTRAMRTSLGLT